MLAGGWDTTRYFFNPDTLFVKEEYWLTDASGDHHIVKWHDFKLLSRQTDTISILYPVMGYMKQVVRRDTLKFIRLENLKEPILSFGYFKISDNDPWNGITNISMDSAGNLEYYREKRDVVTPEGKTTCQSAKRVLSKSEFSKFKDILSYSLLSRLSRYRGGCDAMDAGRTTFDIGYNKKHIISKGCDMKWPYALLYKHIYHLVKKVDGSSR